MHAYEIFLYYIMSSIVSGKNWSILHILCSSTDGYNQRDQQWIANGEWWYTGQFTLNETASKRDHIYLQCDGIDTVSVILYVKYAVMQDITHS